MVNLWHQKKIGLMRSMPFTSVPCCRFFFKKVIDLRLSLKWEISSISYSVRNAALFCLSILRWCDMAADSDMLVGIYLDLCEALSSLFVTHSGHTCQKTILFFSIRQRHWQNGFFTKQQCLVSTVNEQMLSAKTGSVIKKFSLACLNSI